MSYGTRAGVRSLESIRNDGFVSTVRYKLAQHGQTNGCRPLADWSVTIKGRTYNAFEALTSVPMLAAGISMGMLRERPMTPLDGPEDVDWIGTIEQREYLALQYQSDIRMGKIAIEPPELVKIEKYVFDEKINDESLRSLWGKECRLKSKGPRTLSIECNATRILSGAAAITLGSFYSQRLENNVVGCRAGVTCPTVLGALRHAVAETDRKVLLLADIKDFFGSVKPKRVLNMLDGDTQIRHIPELKRLIEPLILNREGKGLPQGNPLSPTLANLYACDTIDTTINLQGPWLRYVDDILVLHETVAGAQEGFERIQKKAEKLGMQLHPEKSIIVDLRTGVIHPVRVGNKVPKEAAARYLGVNFSLESTGLEFSLSDRSLISLLENLRSNEFAPPIQHAHPILSRLVKLSRGYMIVAGWMQAYGFARFSAEQEQALRTILGMSGMTDQGLLQVLDDYKARFAIPPTEIVADIADIIRYLRGSDKADQLDLLKIGSILSDNREASAQRYRNALEHPADLRWIVLHNRTQQNSNSSV
ncbi:hypothetical protein LBMAG53_22110 [Planctomycetota bacterium]|nr:hypothetical protein LBMAG53_22110 [Planctomycetota bacterium]